MKRKQKNPTAETVFPLFSWAQCCSCNIEFKREFGYMLIGDLKDNMYLCSTCGKNKEDAYKLFKKIQKEDYDNRVKNRPKPPPPPPIIIKKN